MKAAVLYKQFLAKVFFATAIIGLAMPTHSVEHDLSDTPLFTLSGVDPNIILTMDDSGSMAWSFMPPSISGNPSTKRAKSAAFNKIYYDPQVEYEPPVDEEGKSLGHSVFADAWDDGFAKTTTCKIDLSDEYRPTWGGNLRNHCTDYDDETDASSLLLYSSDTKEAAYYYLFDKELDSCNNSFGDDDCYKKVIVSATSGPDSADERENFANWYSYYRKRVYVTKTAATLAFSRFKSNIRVGHQRINDHDNDPKINLSGVKRFSGNNRKNFFKWLHELLARGARHYMAQ